MSRDLKINLQCDPAGFSWRVIRKFDNTRDYKKLPRILTGHPNFDATSHVEGFPDEKVQTYLEAASVRESIKDLMAMGFDEIELNRGHITATWHAFSSDIAPSQEFIASTQNYLERLARRLAMLAVPKSGKPRQYQKILWLRVIGAVVFILVLLAGLILKGPVSVRKFMQRSVERMQAGYTEIRADVLFQS